MTRPFIKINRAHLNRVSLCGPDVNGIIGYEYSNNFHNFPVFVHSLGIVSDMYYFMRHSDRKRLCVQTITHNENAPDTTDEVILTFDNPTDVVLFLTDILRGDCAPVARFNPEVIQSQEITQIDYY